MIVAVARVIAISGLIDNYSSRPHELSLNSYFIFILFYYFATHNKLQAE